MFAKWIIFLSISFFLPVLHLVPVAGSLWMPNGWMLFKLLPTFSDFNPLSVIIIIQVLFWAALTYFASWLATESKYGFYNNGGD